MNVNQIQNFKKILNNIEVFKLIVYFELNQ